MPTIEQIHQAANEIEATGVHPSLGRVRLKVGGGSYTTITEGMKLWRAQKQKQKEEEVALSVIKIPSTIKERIDNAGATLWAAAIQEAERRLEAEREELTQKEEQIKEEVNESRGFISILEGEADKLKNENVQLQEKLETAEKERKAKHDELQKQLRCNDLLRQQIDDLTAELSRERERVDKYLEKKLLAEADSQALPTEVDSQDLPTEAKPATPEHLNDLVMRFNPTVTNQ